MSSSLQAHQTVLLQMLKEIDRICKKHDIPYMLFSGTLLGTVREGGFIPWDDDADIVMLRDAYEKFLQVAPEELGAEFFLQKEFSEHWPMFFSKLRKNGTTCIERYVPKDQKTHMGVYVDIFPCDNLYESKFLRKVQFWASKIVIAKSLDQRGYLTDNKLKKVFQRCCRLLPQKVFARFVQHRKGTGEQMVHTFFGGASKYEKNIYPRVWFSETSTMQFENHPFPVSAHYPELLTQLYGDYMVPPPPGERQCKVHAEIVDLEHSYEEYWEIQQKMKFKDYTRSIR